MNRMTKLKIKDFFKVIALCIFAASIPALLALYAVQAKKYTDLTKEVAELEVKQEKLIEENKKLVSDISQLSSAERIERCSVCRGGRSSKSGDAGGVQNRHGGQYECPDRGLLQR